VPVCMALPGELLQPCPFALRRCSWAWHQLVLRPTCRRLHCLLIKQHVSHYVDITSDLQDRKLVCRATLSLQEGTCCLRLAHVTGSLQHVHTSRHHAISRNQTDMHLFMLVCFMFVCPPSMVAGMQPKEKSLITKILLLLSDERMCWTIDNEVGMSLDPRLFSFSCGAGCRPAGLFQCMPCTETLQNQQPACLGSHWQGLYPMPKLNVLYCK
jgi:hypothetical protein